MQSLHCLHWITKIPIDIHYTNICLRYIGIGATACSVKNIATADRAMRPVQKPN